MRIKYLKAWGHTLEVGTPNGRFIYEPQIANEKFNCGVCCRKWNYSYYEYYSELLCVRTNDGAEFVLIREIPEIKALKKLSFITSLLDLQDRNIQSRFKIQFVYSEWDEEGAIIWTYKYRC